MKNKKYHTVETVPKPNKKLHKTQKKSIMLYIS